MSCRRARNHVAVLSSICDVQRQQRCDWAKVHPLGTIISHNGKWKSWIIAIKCYQFFRWRPHISVIQAQWILFEKLSPFGSFLKAWLSHATANVIPHHAKTWVHIPGDILLARIFVCLEKKDNFSRIWRSFAPCHFLCSSTRTSSVPLNIIPGKTLVWPLWQARNVLATQC